MHDFEAAQRKQARAAAERVAASADERRAQIDALRAGAAAETAGRDEKTRRVINTEDFLAVGYLQAGVIASRAVGRVEIKEHGGVRVGYGTGSLVSPSLVLTNNHVLPSAEVAATSMVEFRYEDGVDGPAPTPVAFGLDPARFFLTDEELDFALVAVDAPLEQLAEFGFNRLREHEGGTTVGDFVTIVQHPRGEKKQVALRDNRVVNVLEQFVHYEADTEPGSSGSPVFDDQWDVVSLHHASVPAPDHSELGGIVNEGIRVGSVLKFVRSQSLPAAATALADELVR